MSFAHTYFGDGLKRAMFEQGISNVELARRTGRSAQKISELRNTRISCTLTTAEEIAKGLGMRLSELIALGENNVRPSDDRPDSPSAPGA
jgi:plasmid maintenance system antidote protein VapI